MTRPISTEIIDKFSTQKLAPFNLLEMTIGAANYRYTDCDVPITLSSKRYTPVGFRFAPIKYSMQNIVDEAQVELDNLDSAMTALFAGGTAQGSEVEMKLVLLSSDKTSLVGSTGAVVFQGQIDSWELNERSIRITLTSIFTQWSQRTMARYSPTCRWKVFNSTDLGQTSTDCNNSNGSTWCDRTWDRCETLNNTTNFGGFRWLPSIVDKDIWWGRTFDKS